jgi:hypothetical protein
MTLCGHFGKQQQGKLQETLNRLRNLRLLRFVGWKVEACISGNQQFQRGHQELMEANTEVKL